MLPWRSWHLPGVQGCLGAVLRSPRDIQVLPWGQKGGGGGRDRDLGSTLGCWWGSQGCQGVQGGGPHLQVPVDNELLVAVLHGRHYLQERGVSGGPPHPRRGTGASPSPLGT